MPMLKNKVIQSIVKTIIVPSMLVSSLALSFIAAAHINNPELQAIVLDRDAEDRARDKYRNPVDTLSFFHVEPSMKVVEVLPGGGWYSKILANYLGKDGELLGINYNDDIWAMFGFFSEERINEFVAATAKFPETIAGFTDNGISTSGYTFETVPESENGTVDRILFIRALHNLNRFESNSKARSQALKVSYDLLKPDGLVGVVQHRAPEDAADDWSDGSRGYMKQSTVIKIFEEAGFELVMESDVNENKNDKPEAGDIVWRLPPSFVGVGDNVEKRSAMQLIGESNRMTLLFKK